MHSRIDNCCETQFRLLCVVLRSFIRHTTTEFFYFSTNFEYKMAFNKILNQKHILQRTKIE